MIQEWYVSSKKLTCCVATENGIIRHAPPVLGKFIGQHIKNLIAWMKKQEGFRYTKLSENK